MRRELGWICVGQVAAVAAALASVRVLTELLPVAEYGAFVLAIAVATLAQQSMYGPLAAAIARFVPEAVERNEAGELRGSVMRFLVVATSVMSVVPAVGGLTLVGLGRIHSGTLILACASVAVFLGLSGIAESALNAVRRRRAAAEVQIASATSRIVLAVLAIMVLGHHAAAALAGYALAGLLVMGWQLRRFRRTVAGASVRNREWDRLIMGYAAPIALFGVFTWLHLAADRWSLEWFASTSQVAQYAVLYQLGYYPMSLASTITMQYATPLLFRQAGTGRDRGRVLAAHTMNWQLVRWTLASTMIATALAWLLHPFVFAVFVAREYREASYLLPILTLAGGLFAAGQTASLVLMSGLATQKLVIPKILTSLIAIGLYGAGAKWYGLTGVVVAGLMFSILYCAWMALLATQNQKAFAVMAPAVERI